jgi:hypothetical protein
MGACSCGKIGKAFDVCDCNAVWVDKTNYQGPIAIKEYGEGGPPDTNKAHKDFGKGLKHDDLKPPVDLVDPEFVLGVAKVLQFGARKYAPHNWKKGLEYTRLLAAIERHTLAIKSGEDIDLESGEPHVYHLACTTMFLAWHMKNRQDLDDRSW